MSQKKLSDLTIKDNFLFGAVMTDEKNCRDFLEMVLGFPIARIEISKEKSVVYHPEYKGVRLDIYAQDEEQTCYNVEMQAASRPHLGKRSRYYHSQMDMDLLLSGRDYEDLPPAYVIFICDFDPFGDKKYKYTFCNICEEESAVDLGDERYTIFLSTRGENPQEVSESLVNFLKFVKADLKESKEESEDPFVRQLQKTIEKVKVNREMGERFMVFQEMLSEERAVGRNEGKQEMHKETIVRLLGKLGSLSDSLRKQIEEEADSEVLDSLYEKAMEAESLEQFCGEADRVFATVKQS
ncbi:MAG: Rpn family recombination-promoting nuclease/putative transposase [Clostridiales bacterium]|nr:Rpn family recombination-promoting nuclease/putative transposase [Clostridiales bacterium]